MLKNNNDETHNFKDHSNFESGYVLNYTSTPSTLTSTPTNLSREQLRELRLKRFTQ